MTCSAASGRAAGRGGCGCLEPFAMPRHTGLRALETVARTISLPSEERPIRHPSFPDLRRTAVLKFELFSDCTVAPTQDGATLGFLVNQPGLPLWVTATAANSALQYSFRDHEEDWLLTEDNGEIDAGKVYLSYSQAWPFSANPVGLDFGAPIGLDAAGTQWVYHIGGLMHLDLIRTGGANFTAGNTAAVQLLQWKGPGLTIHHYGLLSFSSADVLRVEWTLPVGWYRMIRLTAKYDVHSPGQSVFYQIASTIGTHTALFPVMRHPVESTTTGLPYLETRSNSMSVLFTNVTKALNKEGTVTAGRLSPQLVGYMDFTRSHLSAVHPAEKYFSGLENGFYTYCAMGDAQRQFRDYLYREQSGYYAPIFYLEDPTVYNAFCFSDPDGQTALAVTLSYHVEFVTSSTIFTLGVSDLSLETLHLSQVALLKHGFFFENPTHWSELAKKIKSGLGVAIQAVKPYVPAVLDTVAGLKGLPMPVRAGAFVASRVMRTRIQPTKLMTAVAPPTPQPRPKKKKRMVRTPQRSLRR